MYDYYGINLFKYNENEIKTIRSGVDRIINLVYFTENNNFIFDSRVRIKDLYSLNKMAADEIVKMFDNSNFKFILDKKDRKIMRFYFRRRNLLDGIKIIQDLKGVAQK